MSDKLRGSPYLNSMPRPSEPGWYIPFASGFPRGMVSWDYRPFAATMTELYLGIGPDRHVEPAIQALRQEFNDD